MKKILFIRHGKAEDESPEISDFERSLTLKGKVVSKIMAHILKEKEKSPGIIVSSPAFRAIETALIVAGEYGLNYDNIVMNSNLYYTMNLQNLSVILSGLNEDVEVLTLVGHNPSFTQIANSLSKEGCDFIPKSGIVCISFNILKWSEIVQNSGKIKYFFKPE